jgi:hypothetical protein
LITAQEVTGLNPVEVTSKHHLSQVGVFFCDDRT